MDDQFGTHRSGTQFQSEQPPPMYPATIMFNAGRRNDEIGIADYPSLNCTFSLRLITDGNVNGRKCARSKRATALGLKCDSNSLAPDLLSTICTTKEDG